MNPILVTGGKGQLGTELHRLSGRGGWPIVALDREALDLSDLSAVRAALNDRAWAAVINAGAYTAVDSAETNQAEAWKINAVAPAVLGQHCAAANIPLIQVSTDYVFSGNSRRAWRVSDPTGPLSVYGASKLGGELAVRASSARHAIVRTSWVVSATGSNFLKTMLRLSADQPKLRVVDDQIGSPTSAADLASALFELTVRMANEADAPTGTFHFSNAGTVSWAGFARELFRQSHLRGGPTSSVEPITTAEYPTPARRPACSSLSCGAITHHYGIAPRPWQAAIGEILDELIGTIK